jgi:Flp pilus assembly protein TadG
MQRFLSNNSGTTAIEFALVLPVYLIVILGIFATSLMLWEENSIQYAAEQAARCASVNVIDCGTAGVVDQTKITNAAIGWTNGILSSGDTGKVTVNLGVNCTQGAITMTGNQVIIQYAVTLFVISTTLKAESCYPLLS